MASFFIRTSCETITVHCGENWTLFNLKHSISAICGIPAKSQTLSLESRILDGDSLCLADLEVENLASLDLNVGVVGGKIHGGLAKVGKVKGQTPKVEPQEKKKKKTGRAKQRILYNRRFVNAVQAPGRKLGPNANN